MMLHSSSIPLKRTTDWAGHSLSLCTLNDRIRLNPILAGRRWIVSPRRGRAALGLALRLCRLDIRIQANRLRRTLRLVAVVAGSALTARTSGR
ncbi:hypothetical protein HYQ46_002350 [Verticillium longisporum]|nr:hypothetical protein HYQ46_002350 [Verticillium longisporum]